MNEKKMLITGISGLLGNNLAHYFKRKYEITGVYHNHPVVIEGVHTQRCNLVNEAKTGELILKYAPDVVIHCASLANIDQCESDPKLATNLNVLITKNIVAHLQKRDTQLVYISTDAVYDGVQGFCSEKETSPQNHYGHTKLAGEKEALKQVQALVLRTNIFGWNIQNKKSLGEWILSELQSERQINGFKDATFSSIYTFELAKIIDIALQQRLSGVYNCASVDSCSKYEFALKIADWFDRDPSLIYPASIDDMSFQATRGKNLSLNVQKLQTALNYKFPTINQSIESFYRDAQCGLAEEIKQHREEVSQERSFISYGRQWIEEDDLSAVQNILQTGWITQGPKVDQFGEALAEYCSAQYALVVNSGTSALHIACLAAGIQKGDQVITSPITFVASANCAVYCGATPVFADIDPQTYTIDLQEIEKQLTPQTKAIIPVHFAGQSCDMERLCVIVKEAEQRFDHKIYIIEDASHALGSLYQQNRVGSCTYSDMAVLSFHPVKHITTGEGGATLTNDEALFQRLKLFGSHGIQKNSNIANQRWHYEQVELGYNFRITDFQCALGLSQLYKIDSFISRRREIVNYYNEEFSKMAHLQIPFEATNCISNFHLYVLLFDFEQIGITRNEFMTELVNQKIQTQVHYIPVHTQPYYHKNFNTDWGDFPKAEAYYQKCLSIPLFPAMKDHDVAHVINTIKSMVGESA